MHFFFFAKKCRRGTDSQTCEDHSGIRPVTLPPWCSPGPADRGIRVHVLESYCLSVRHAAIDCFAAAPGDAPVTHHTAFGESLLDAFCGDGTRALLQTLGMDESSPIFHRRVDRSILRARQKRAAHIDADGPAAAQVAWMRTCAGHLFAAD